jgi:hypothetical protein
LKDTGATIRSIYSGLLAGITYNSVSVPVYTEEPLKTCPDNYIVLLSTDQTDLSNDTRWSHEVFQTIDIVTKANMINSRTAVDSITNSVLEALLPTSFVVREDTNFTVHIINATVPGYIHSQDGSVHINRKIIRVLNHLIQK